MIQIRSLILKDFDDVIPVRYAPGTLYLCIKKMPAPAVSDACGEAVIHPYYPISQKAYLAAAEICRQTGAELRNDLHLKPLLARLPQFVRGINTLSYYGKQGSRFHIQTILTPYEDEEAVDLLPENTPTTVCSQCGACIRACPTGALTPEGFLRDRCIRNWQLSGKLPPEEVLTATGNRLIGCDVCQHACPLNKDTDEETVPLSFPLRDLLTGQTDLRELIGTNLAVKNRVLVQACVLSESLHRSDLLPELEQLTSHPSQNVSAAAKHAVDACFQTKNGL